MRLVVALLFGLSTVACVDASSLTDAEKIQRIDSMYERFSEEFPQAGEITATELLAMLGSEDLVLVDVRTEAERQVSIIPGAISKEEFEARGDQFVDRTVVTYCTIGYRSGLYAAKLNQVGLDALNLRGSILSWTHEGGTLVRDGEPTKQVHVFGGMWDLAAEEFESTW